jgi:hypothetical protein
VHDQRLDEDRDEGEDEHEGEDDEEVHDPFCANPSRRLCPAVIGVVSTAATSARGAAAAIQA